MVIDSHHHLWDPERGDYAWMTGAFAPLRRRFDVDALRDELKGTEVQGTVVVQARCDTSETFELLAVTEPTSLVRGVIGWLDLMHPASVSAQVAAFRAAPGGAALVGIRHLVQDEPDPRWLLREPVQQAIGELGRAALVYDFVVRPEQLPAVLRTVQEHPDTRFVIDHLAKPRIAKGQRDPEWAAMMQRLSRLPNVCCKLSGLVTEAEWDSWTVDQLRPYVELAYEWFGGERLMFGSDWPVCALAATYRQVLDAILDVLSAATPSVRAQVMGLNAVAFYGL